MEDSSCVNFNCRVLVGVMLTLVCMVGAGCSNVDFVVIGVVSILIVPSKDYTQYGYRLHSMPAVWIINYSDKMSDQTNL